MTFLINLPPQDMQRRLSDALGVYVDAMRYPPGTENQRAAMWLEHTRRRGWQAVAAVEVDAPAGAEPSSAELSDAPLLGVAYLVNRMGGVMEAVFFAGFTVMIVTELAERTSRASAARRGSYRSLPGVTRPVS